MPTVGMYGYAWMRGGTIVAWGTGRSEATRVVDDHFQSWAHARTAKTSKKEGLARRGKDGQGRQSRAHGVSAMPKGPN